MTLKRPGLFQKRRNNGDRRYEASGLSTEQLLWRIAGDDWLISCGRINETIDFISI